MPADLGQTFDALADSHRRAVVALLRQEPRRSGDLAQALSMNHPTMSRHLRVLRKAGLVQEEIDEEDARVRVYSLRPEPFAELRSWLDEVESFWTDQLGSFKAHAERRGKTRS
ncbi:MAG: winged helix-turn-helix transcriptional regulator [Candidatus Eisenbacteria bacterium]|uniref:Winged helix-turn-helix transcriptional regulator n=1 Tax=Eiseniibacteriota bacterium TaxID=2212470 RepID=A0A956RQI7_UNCEI|nr:winged helix-turn-helix transcriptional regulator [Candidatus Eisenbacteria bacterium]